MTPQTKSSKTTPSSLRPDSEITPCAPKTKSSTTLLHSDWTQNHLLCSSIIGVNGRAGGLSLAPLLRVRAIKPDLLKASGQVKRSKLNPSSNHSRLAPAMQGLQIVRQLNTAIYLSNQSIPSSLRTPSPQGLFPGNQCSPPALDRPASVVSVSGTSPTCMELGNLGRSSPADEPHRGSFLTPGQAPVTQLLHRALGYPLS